MDNITLDDIIFEKINKKENENFNLIFDTKSENGNIENKKGIFEWTKLNKKWENKLLSNNFYKYDCINNNFCNIENALINSGLIKTNSSLKQKIKNYLKEIPFDDFSRIINNYKFCNEQNKEYIGNLNLNNIKSRNVFIKEITKRDFSLQGDNVTLYIISEILNVDFIIFNDETNEIIDLTQNNKLNDNIIIIYKQLLKNTMNNDSEEGYYNHYKNNNLNHHQDDKEKMYIIKLIGLKNKDEIKTKFKRNKVPEDLHNILDRHDFLLLHVQKVINDFKINKKKITIRGIMKDIMDNIKSEINDNEINDIMIILYNLINQENFKKSIKNK